MNALQQFLQSASNAAASNVSGPVDLIAAGLRKLGVPVPQNALMSSQWMEEQGLTRKVPQNALSLAGETLGMVAPIAAAAKAPQIAAAMNQAGANLAAPKTLNPQAGAIVWHGSPHKFDKFDSSKIGTGEGAQAYGHGLYLADDAKVAGSYQEKLSGSLPTEIAAGGQAMDFRAAAAQAFGEESADALVKSGAHMRPDAWSAVADVLRSKGLKDARPMAGNLYKVDLPDTAISRMLDWDKPLSQQAPEVQSAFYLDRFPNASIKDITGLEAYVRTGQALGEASSDSAKAAQHLRKKGIPGIRYLDGGSRGAGAGTYNYVVFPGEENMLRILERNGQPLR